MPPKGDAGLLNKSDWDALDGRLPLARPIVGGRHRRTMHRLGPLFSFVAMDHPVLGRVYAAGIVGAVVAAFTVAARLAPNPEHVGTHQQLGLPPCGFMVMTGLPCPTCGMTTAFTYAVRGQFIEAMRAQPAGFVLAVGMACLGIIALAGVVTGKRLAPNWYRVDPVRVLWLCMALVVLAWGVNVVRVLLASRASAG